MQHYEYDDYGNLVIIEMGDPYIGGGDDGDVLETTTSFHDHGHGPATTDIPWWYSSVNSQYSPTATATATDGTGSGGSGSTQTTAAAQLASTPIQSFGSYTTLITSPAGENVGSYSTTQTTTSPSSSSSSDASSGAQSSPSAGGPPPGPDQFHTAKLALAVIVPLVVLIFGAIAFLVMRKKKRQQFQQKQTREMSMQPPTYPSAPEYSFIPQPPPPTIPSGTSPMVPPIIIAPMSAGSNSGYMTGMDTSDAVSVRDASPAYNGYASVEDSEEPPPPYRPRSLAPASRNSSVRHPPVADGFYGTHLMAGQGQTHEDPFADQEASMPVANGRSPFADPGDNDDNVSEISDVEEGHDMRRRNMEVLSDVSDLSYQHEFHSMEGQINR